MCQMHVSAKGPQRWIARILENAQAVEEATQGKLKGKSAAKLSKNRSRFLKFSYSIVCPRGVSTAQLAASASTNPLSLPGNSAQLRRNFSRRW
jgi:hypothetical protein